MRTHPDGSVGNLDPELSRDMFRAPCAQLVPIVQTISVLENWLDGDHTEEAFACLVAIVHRDMQSRGGRSKIAGCQQRTASYVDQLTKRPPLSIRDHLARACRAILRHWVLLL